MNNLAIAVLLTVGLVNLKYWHGVSATLKPAQWEMVLGLASMVIGIFFFVYGLISLISKFIS